MEVTVYEDPACSWCWAFEPVATVLAFEWGHALPLRRVMGGLRDRPAADADFMVNVWNKAGAVSGMPFATEIWTKHSLRTTYLACRAVIAAGVLGEHAAHRLLRRLREAFYTEETGIDKLETVLRLATAVGIDKDDLLENLNNGRAEALFARDRDEATHHGFGFPTLVFRMGHEEAPTVLQGAVPYEEVLECVLALGIPPESRRVFAGAEADWQRLFKVHSRLTPAEIRAVTGWSSTELEVHRERLGLEADGVFLRLRAPASDAAERPAAHLPADLGQPAPAARKAGTEGPVPAQLADSQIGGGG